MKYGYTVKHNGVLYPAGAEVPVESDEEKEQTEQAPADNKDGAEEDDAAPKRTRTKK